MNLLFWNINKKSLANEIKSLCDFYDVDILILAENTLPDAKLLPDLNEGNDRIFIASHDQPKKISFYTRIHAFKQIQNDDWGSIRKLVHPLGIEILLVAVHIQSKLYLTETEQTVISARIAREIDRCEQEHGHTRTIVIGDFNMNPFEHGLVCSDGFHGVMDKHIALKQSRTVLGEEKKLFYNPMWSRLGDDSEGCAGTYYYNSSNMINYFWNAFDQVLLRPSLLSCFTQHDLKVIDKIDEVSLIKNGKISNQFSEHLPLMVKLTMSQFSGDK